MVSPWQTCATGPPPPEGRINCTSLGDYIHNTRLDYVVSDLTTDVTHTVSTHPINTRNGFGGGFFGDYTDIAVGSDNVFHAFWTDSNNMQTVVWFYGARVRADAHQPGGRRDGVGQLLGFVPHPSEKARPAAGLLFLSAAKPRSPSSSGRNGRCAGTA